MFANIRWSLYQTEICADTARATEGGAMLVRAAEAVRHPEYVEREGGPGQQEEQEEEGERCARHAGGERTESTASRAPVAPNYIQP